MIHGAARDVDALGHMAVAVFALSAVPLRSGMNGKDRAAVAVCFGDATFTPGARIYGDRYAMITCRHEMCLE